MRVRSARENLLDLNNRAQETDREAGARVSKHPQPKEAVMKQIDPTKALTRRQILTAGATTALGGMVLGVSGTSAIAQASGLPAAWDEEVDVVVIGTGFAG